jgi:hypothetical protein
MYAKHPSEKCFPKRTLLLEYIDGAKCGPCLPPPKLEPPTEFHELGRNCATQDAGPNPRWRATVG